ncbi:hypothetical protein MNBD_GAMMA25-925 [hydrothermal vent metagenome]|uniref:Uncharacterized protein n=1 Tax=hydrothermal vent metagenome TaxID=652676 RepID=A0A3B1ARY9_9ZZZZ
MATKKDTQNLLNKITPYSMCSGIFDYSIIIALLSLVSLSWFINNFLIT